MEIGVIFTILSALSAATYIGKQVINKAKAVRLKEVEADLETRKLDKENAKLQILKGDRDLLTYMASKEYTDLQLPPAKKEKKEKNAKDHQRKMVLKFTKIVPTQSVWNDNPAKCSAAIQSLFLRNGYTLDETSTQTTNEGTVVHSGYFVNHKKKIRMRWYEDRLHESGYSSKV